ncbi:MAG TPA: YfjI family protein [Gemmataceae bacterium]|nr:YfjI family protein [Gemmataceae bacterium]
MSLPNRRGANKPGSQPHNQIASTFEQQLQRLEREGAEADARIAADNTRLEAQLGYPPGDSYEGPPAPVPPPQATPSRNGQHSKTAEPPLPSLVSEWRPFPLDALPEILHQYVNDGAKALGCDPAMIALPVLASCAGAIGHTRVVSPKRDWREPLVTWGVVVADSGTLKSPAHDKAVQPIRDVQAETFAKHKREVAAFNEAKGRGEEPEEPEEPRIIQVSDTTIEKLVGTLDDNRRGVLLEMDELHAWLNSFTRYKGSKGGTDAPQWLSIHRAGPVRYDRKTGDKRRVYVPNAAVSVCGTIQLAILKRAIDGDLLDSGMSARLLFAMPPEKRKVWTEMEVSEDTESLYVELVKRLLALVPEHRNGIDRPFILKLDPEAKEIWIGHYNQWAEVQREASGPIKAAFAKLEGGALRFAGIHHICTQMARVDGNDRCPITADSIKVGIALAKWFAHEAERVLAMLGESEDQREERHLTDWIRNRGGVVTARQLQRHNQRRYPTADHAAEALAQLAKAGFGQWKSGTREFVLNREAMAV